MSKHTVLITGAAGYVGGMLVRAIAKREDVERIIGLDKEPLPDFIKDVPNLTYFQMNTADEWEGEVRAYAPDIVIHTAWQIREIYGNRPLSWKWNIDGSEKVFTFALQERQVKRLIHYSTVASYGAFPENTTEHRYVESEPFRVTDYLYAEEKRVAEERLEAAYKKRTNAATVAIIRPAAITGPRGRFMRIRFGLQAALSGTLKGEKSFFYNLVSLLVSWVPVTPKWLRQFVHEDDIVAVTLRLAFDEVPVKYEAFNIAPPGPAVYGEDMAKAVGKRLWHVSPQFLRIGFFFAWHLSRGKIPTAKGSWKGYSYPINVDGSKATRLLGFNYSASSFDAFYYTNGLYESEVPAPFLRHKDA